MHEVDWRAAGLDWLVPAGTTPGLDTQVSLWERYARTELRDHVHPLVDHAFGVVARGTAAREPGRALLG